jgi:tetratricopeptide (TPR) repeat protein
MKNILHVCMMICCLVLLGPAAHAEGRSFEAELAAIQSDWAVANYNLPSGDAKVQALASLANRAEAFATANPSRAEPLVWQGIVLSTLAGAKGGLGALKLAKQSRTCLQASIDIDPKALDGSAYTSLGTLYFKVPGFPLGFGDEDKAAEYLQRALAINPDGIDANFFYGEFLLKQHKNAQALDYLQKALRASPRPGRELADAGRRAEIAALIAKIRGEQVA